MIPARLLIHNCTYSTITGTDRDGNKVYNNIELSRVRFAPVTMGTAQATAGETKDDKLVLYIDVQQTTPAVVPEELARVTWNGKAYTIRSVTPCYTRNTEAVHHYEAALI